jgi:HEAT repeat protein
VDVVRAAAGDEAPIAALNAAAHRQRGASEDLGTALRDPDVGVRRAAAYVAALWADGAEDVATLTPLLTDADPGVQAMVAGSLAGLGDGAARATLESLRSSTALMPWSEPPMTVGDFAGSAIAAIDAVGRRQ